MSNKLPTYSEIHGYSPMRDCVVIRISIADAHGQELWTEIEGEGKAYREAKAAALQDLMKAFERGDQPGQVVRTVPRGT
jgi:hypothetical protein